MCGITGYLTPDKTHQSSLCQALEAMTQQLYNRGPDHQEQWVSQSGLCGLGHARLSILDLSTNGSQPMSSPSGRYQLVFNGEIYNYQELRADLLDRGATFKGSSDSEVLITAIEYYGVTTTLDSLIGMFAFAVWDEQDQRLYLARDRAGEKPLYYGYYNNRLVFTSDLNVFKVCPDVELTLNTESLGLFLAHNYIPAPHSIFRNVYKLLPGHCLTIDIRDGAIVCEENQFWSLDDALNQPRGFDSDTQALAKVEELLTDSVDKQMVSDVPLGALLSGGIDSSTIVALMQSLSNTAVNTFTIGFEEKAFDESGHAEKIAQHLGTNHHTLILKPEDVMAVIPKLSDIYSEPFADSSQLPTYLVSQLARKHVTVALSGDGGDELFAGYDRYQQTLNRYPSGNVVTHRQNSNLAARLTSNFKGLDRIIDPLLSTARNYPTSLSSIRFYRRWQQRHTHSLQSFYRHAVEYWPYGFLQRHQPADVNFALNDPGTLTPDIPPLKALQYLDMLSYLPDDILCKVDRAAMANSLETRAPLLDHRMLELSMSLPSSLLQCEGKSKWPLRQILYKHVPRALIERPKMGFAIPIGAWIRGPLREWAETLLSPLALDEHGLLDSGYIQYVWHRHLKGDTDLSFYLWGILMFQQWYQSWKSLLK